AEDGIRDATVTGVQTCALPIWSELRAVLTDPEEVARQVRSLVTHGEVVASDGSHVLIAFETLCLHGDTPGSVVLASRIRRELLEIGRASCRESVRACGGGG